MPVLSGKVKTLDDINVEEKTVLLRLDINCPLGEKGELLDTTRIRAALPTVQELSERNAKVVILAHQGRNGKKDCVTLEAHGKALSQILGEEVVFVRNASDLQGALENAKWGAVLLLENQRFEKDEEKELSPDEHANSPFILSLAKLGDLFVNDAFSAAHRSQRSLVGFCPLMPSAVGRVMEKELENLEKLANPEKPSLFIFGGAKVEGVSDLVEKLLSGGKADKILLGGLTGLAFVLASGHSLGPTDSVLQKELSLEEMGKLAELLEKYPLRIILPSDHSIEKDGWKAVVSVVPTQYPIYDIGPETQKQFGAEIAVARTIFLSGPLGLFEKDGFSEGTKAALEAISKRTLDGAHTVIGGGHTNAAIEKLGFSGKFTYQSTGGGALETFITGGRMPVLDALENSFKG